jgi:hypothetical protein
MAAGELNGKSALVGRAATTAGWMSVIGMVLSIRIKRTSPGRSLHGPLRQHLRQLRMLRVEMPDARSYVVEVEVERKSSVC